MSEDAHGKQFEEYHSEHQVVFNRINAMGREEMCRLWRFAPSGHPYFDTEKPYYEVFKARFDKLGGFSPEISKRIGWDG